MGRLTREDIVAGLTRLGELAEQQGKPIELALIGGAVMALHYQERDSTKDVDSVILAPSPASLTRDMVVVVAGECGWDEDWLNDAVKGYVGVPKKGPIVFRAPGITVWMVAVEQQLALKLAAWRDDVDFDDALRLLRDLASGGPPLTPDAVDLVRKQVEQYFPKGSELKACYALEELIELFNGDDRADSGEDS